MYVAPGFLERLLVFSGLLAALALFVGFALFSGKKTKEKDLLPQDSSDTSSSDAETRSFNVTDSTDKELSTALAPPFAALHSDKLGTLPSGNVSAAFFVELPFLSSVSWVLILLSVALCATSLWLASSISNYGSIANLQAQTNEVLFAVIVALASVAAGIVAVFLRLCARSTV